MINANSVSYICDNIGQRTSIIYPNDCKIEYTYDGNGNKIAMLESVDGEITNCHFSFDATNKLIEETGDMQVKYHHGKSENVTKKEHPSGLIENFTYNSEGQLIQVLNNQGKTITYQHDGRRSVIGQQTEKNNALHFKISYNDFVHQGHFFVTLRAKDKPKDRYESKAFAAFSKVNAHVKKM